MANKRFTIQLMLLAVLSFAVSLAVVRFGMLERSLLLTYCGMGGIVASFGWPIGYLLGGGSGAYYCAMLSVGALFVLLVLATG